MSGSEPKTRPDNIPGWPQPGSPGWQGLNKPELEKVLEPAPVGFDHSVPYPEAPPVDHSDPDQEHYIGAKDPEQAK